MKIIKSRKIEQSRKIKKSRKIEQSRSRRFIINVEEKIFNPTHISKK